jgi:predicted dienelactone hydrolase
MRSWVWTVLGLFTIACHAAVIDPSQTGPYAVGVKTVTVTDPDPTRANADGSLRTIVTEIWYPTTDAALGKSGATYDVLPLLTDEERQQLQGVALPLVKTSAVRDAPPRRDKGAFPLVLYSHGQAEMRWAAAFVTVTLASHGFIVVAPDHPHHTLGDAAHNTLDDQGTEIGNRPLDMMLLMDTFSALPADDSLAGLVDASRIGISGHSFGALTALRTAAMDPRIKAAAPMAPPAPSISWIGLGDSGHPVQLNIPVLLSVGHKDTITPWDTSSKPTWDALLKPRFLLDFKTGGHYTFTNLCGFAPFKLPIKVGMLDVQTALANGCPNGDAANDAPPPAQAELLINHFAVGFFLATLGEQASMFDLMTQAHADALAPGLVTFTADR